MLARGIVAGLYVTVLVFGQQTSQKQLTARELFYAAAQASAKAAEPPKAAPKADTAKAAPKTARPARTPPKPVEVAVADSRPNTSAGVQVISSAKTAPMPASGQPLGLRINVQRYNPDGSTTDVLPDTVFHSGDRIRFSVEPNARGFLYVVNRGSSGTWKAMFPSPEIEGGDNRVDAMHPYVVPPGKHVFTFDATVGTENLFVVCSRQPVPDLEDLMYSLKSGKKPSEAPPAQTDKTLVMAMNIGDPAIDRLRNAYARDLIIETVNPGTLGDKQETAVYVVNPTGSEESRVVADIKLVHQ